MAKITIDNVEYDTDDFTDESKVQLMSLQYCDMEIQNLQAEAAALQAARNAYLIALKTDLAKPKVGSGKSEESASLAEAGNGFKSKGLLGGLFGKK